MRALSICLGLALLLGCLVGDSKANITVSKINNAGQTFSSGGQGGLSATGSKSVTFTAADFNNHPTADIISIEVAISFTKLSGTGAQDIYPYYNEIQMTFGKPEVGNTTLIAPGPVLNPAANAFGPGPFRNPGDPAVGFDGVLTFRSALPDNNPATQQVNANPFVIPTTGKYLPAGATATPWQTFLGQSAIGTFTLNLGDVDGAGDTSLDPLVFRSMTVTINAVPEPSSFAAFGLLAVGGTFIRRRRARG